MSFLFKRGGTTSVLLERLTTPATTRISILFLPFPPSGTLRSRFLFASCLTPRHPLPSGGTLLTDGSRPTYHRHPHVQNPASGVNVPEFPRAFLLNMHLPRAPARGEQGERNRRWTEVGGEGGGGRTAQRDSFCLSRCSRLECGMTVFAIT